MWSKPDRVMAVLNGERPDQVPIFECLVHDGILEHFGGRKMETGDLEGALRACSECLDLCHPALLPREPKRIENADGTVTVTERWTSWTTPRRFASESEKIRVLHNGIDSAEDLKSVNVDVEAFKTQVERNNRYAGDMLYINIGTYCHILPFDIEQGVYAYTDHPDLVRRWNKSLNTRRLSDLDSQLTALDIPVCIIWNDIAFKDRLIWPPELLKELFYPHLAAMVELMHSHGAKVVFHSDGNVTEALPHLIECGIDAFNPLEISAGMDPVTFSDEFGSDVALVGGIDAVEVLARGTPDQVVTETKRLIDLFRDRGNMMIASASGQVDNSMPTENVLAMYETAWSYGKY